MILTLLLGLVVLTVGAELLVRGAAKLATAAGISPLVVGLTVVAYGTSAPELVVSVQSTLAGQHDVALGNVVGSNIFNVLFILGVSALIVPLRVSQQLIRFDVPLMIVLSIAVLLFAWDGEIGRAEGLLLVAGLIGYTLWAVVKSRREQAAIQAEYEAAFGVDATARVSGRSGLNVATVIAGLALLVVGSRWFVEGAVSLARDLGVSELVIGLTIVAAGTSLPEVATSILAAVRGERDIAVGNVVGSNIFNIMGVLGLSGVISAGGITVSEAALWFDIPVMIAVAIACLPIFFTGSLIARWEGALFLLYYCIYTISIMIAVTASAHTRSFALIILGTFVPLTVIMLTTGVVRHLRSQPAKESEQ